jgi:predicted AAA+ superfamily ATPase
MIGRDCSFPRTSFFLFGPRGSGKSYWLRNRYSRSTAYIDLLQARVFNRLCADPQRLSESIPKEYEGPVIIDGIQKVPALLDEVR